MKRSLIWLSFVSVVLLGLLFSPAASSASQIADAPKATPSATPPPIPAAMPRWTLANSEAAGEWLTYATGDDISSVVVDGDDIWAASTGGLLRWNAQTGDLIQYLAPQVPLPGNNLSQLLLHDGKLYISAQHGVTIFDREDGWTTYTAEKMGVVDEWFDTMVMADDTLWVGTESGLLKLLPDGRWEVIRSGADTFPYASVEALIAKPDGVYVQVTTGGALDQRKTAVAKYANGDWQAVQDNLPDYVTAPDGSWWKHERGEDAGRIVTSTSRGLTWRTIYTGKLWLDLEMIDPLGRVYVSDDDKVVVIDHEQVVKTYRFTDLGPELNYVGIIKHDSAGRTWIGTGGRGLTMFDGQAWHNWQPETSAMREDSIRGMAVSDDKIYLGLFGCGGCGGVAIYDIQHDTWTNFWPGESELSGGGVGGIALDAQGRAYLPTSAGILDIYADGQWQHIKMEPMLDNAILSTDDGLFDRQGHYWLATSGLGFGLWEYDGQHWTTHLSGYDVNGLALDSTGRIWAATSTGLTVRDVDGTWYAYTAEDAPIGDGWLQDVAIDAEGRVWTVNTEGLYVFNGVDWQTFTPEQVGASLFEGALDVDTQGRAWIGTSFSGVAIFNGKLKIDPFVGLNNPPQAEARQARFSNEPPSFWSLVGQSMCLMVGVPGAWAFARLRHIARRKQMRAEERINRS